MEISNEIGVQRKYVRFDADPNHADYPAARIEVKLLVFRDFAAWGA